MIVTQELVLPANTLTQLSINMSDVEGQVGAVVRMDGLCPG